MGRTGPCLPPLLPPLGPRCLGLKSIILISGWLQRYSARVEPMHRVASVSSGGIDGSGVCGVCGVWDV